MKDSPKLFDIAKSAQVLRSVGSKNPVRASRRELRSALEDLQRAVENSVTAVVTSDLNVAAHQAADALGQFAHAGSSSRAPRIIDVLATSTDTPAAPHIMPGPHQSAQLLKSNVYSSQAQFPFSQAAPASHERFNYVLTALNSVLMAWIADCAPLARVASATCRRAARNLTWRPAHAAGLAVVLLLALVSITVGHIRTRTSAENLSQPAGPLTTYTADPEDTNDGQLLTVMARPRQTLQEISVLYAGRFDAQLLRQIREVNPEVSDPEHIQAGQLLRIPLPAGKLHKIVETAPDPGAGSGAGSGVLTRSVALLHAMW